MDAQKQTIKIHLELSGFPSNTSTNDVEEYLNGFCKEVKSVRFKSESNNTICYVSLIFDVDDSNIEELIEAISGTPFNDNQIKAKKYPSNDKARPKKPSEKDPSKDPRAPMIFDNENDPLPISIPKLQNDNDKSKNQSGAKERERERNNEKNRGKVKESDRDYDHISRREKSDRDKDRRGDKDRDKDRRGSDYRKDRRRH